MHEWLDSAGPDTFSGGGEEDLTTQPGAASGGVQPALSDHLWLYDDGAIWDLGPALVDADHDGVLESLTRGAAGGMTVYTDRDLDGRIDRITAVQATGETRVADLDLATGQWQSTALGRLD
ncbi:MAG: hypothetical protein QM658_00325 [Gordonia sp. (in: high G+C Gram-positive bacteria)]